MEPLSNAAKYTLQFINRTNKSIFLTGKAGTGKTTLLKEILETTHKNTVVVAPTGIAALNASGVTIHSMFQLPFGAFVPDTKNTAEFGTYTKFESKLTLGRHFRMTNARRNVIKNMELLIIDEVSMLRADVLDAIDFMLKKTRRADVPFGGVQVLFIGDLLQLPPIVKPDEWHVLKHYYRGMFFFHAQILQQYPPLYIELDKIFRQTDAKFISVLNNLRNNTITNDDVAILNEFVNPNFDFKANPGYIVLTTHNAKADSINYQALTDLEGIQLTYSPEITGDFPDKIYPLDPELALKKGAQIMFIKNDPSPEKNFFNGKMGVIASLNKDEILVHFPEENKTIEVEKYEWQNIKYTVNENTKEIEEEVIGTFVHYPIKLAWAITVHKSQGLTFDKAALDVSQVFAPGQAYVALSRLRSLNGLVLLSKMQMNGISSDVDVLQYAQNKATEAILEHSLVSESRLFILNSLLNAFDFKEIVQEWRNHFFSYNEAGSLSPKAKHKDWATAQHQKMDLLLVPSSKFASQINKIFREQELDHAFVNQRIEAAYTYFFNTFHEVYFDLLYKMEEVKRIKKVKEFFTELANLEDLQLKAILHLKKAKLIANMLLENKELTKENLSSQELKNYKKHVQEIVQIRYKTNNADLVNTDDDAGFYSDAKPEKPKEPKKSTFAETLELWKQNLSVSEIASRRKLTESTIYGHFIKLIQNDSVQLTDLLSDEKILELQVAFKDFDGGSLGEIKERQGDTFTWEELKLYKATLGA